MEVDRCNRGRRRQWCWELGLVKRMRPLTNDLPKPLVKLAGRPMIDFVLDTLERAGVETIVVNVHYLADKLEAHLRRRAGVRVIISDERAALARHRRRAWSRRCICSDPDRSTFTIPIRSRWAGWAATSAASPTRSIRRHGHHPAAREFRLGARLRRFRRFPDGEQRRLSAGGRNARWRRSSSPAPRSRRRSCSTTRRAGHSRSISCGIAPSRLDVSHGIRQDGVWMHIGSPDAIEQAERFISRWRGLLLMIRGSRRVRGPRVLTVPSGTPFLPALARAVLAGDLPSPGGAAAGPPAASRHHHPAADPARLPGAAGRVPRCHRRPRDAAAANPPDRRGRRGRRLSAQPRRRRADCHRRWRGTAAAGGRHARTTAGADLAGAGVVAGDAQRRRSRPAMPSMPPDAAPDLQETTPAQASHLAADLARLLDSVETEERDLANLAGLVPDAYSDHWQRTLDFLAIVTESLAGLSCGARGDVAVGAAAGDDRSHAPPISARRAAGPGHRRRRHRQHSGDRAVDAGGVAVAKRGGGGAGDRLDACRAGVDRRGRRQPVAPAGRFPPAARGAGGRAVGGRLAAGLATRCGGDRPAVAARRGDAAGVDHRCLGRSCRRRVPAAHPFGSWRCQPDRGEAPPTRRRRQWRSSCVMPPNNPASPRR